jgi:hypothetical protein
MIIKNKTSTKTITLRINEEVLKRLDSESKRRGISLNTFANQIFQEFLDWDMLQPQSGMIPIAKPVIIEMLKKMSKEEVTALAKQVGKDTIHDAVVFMKQRMNLDSFLSWLEMWTKKNSNIGFSHRLEDDGVHVCIMKHDLGEKWSLYHKTVLETISNDILQKPIDIATSAGILTFKIKE